MFILGLGYAVNEEGMLAYLFADPVYFEFW